MKILGCTILLLASALSSFAAPISPDRISGAIANKPSVTLTGNVHPKAILQNDQGAVEPGMKLGYITMVFQPTAAQQADLKQFLMDLQDPSSPDHHKWLSPEEYADRFGVSQHDMQKVQDWLTAQGFSVLQPARGRDWIAFSGNAQLVGKVFQTEIHYYMVDGRKHFANATNPSIPEALSGMVIGFRGMNNFSPKPMMVKSKRQSDSVRPDYSSGGFNNLAPADIATIYDLGPLYAGGFNGTGQTVVVVGQSDISTTDIANFRSGFGLPAIQLTTTVVPGDTDPGIVAGDEDESHLDIEWIGAVAQNASIKFIIGNPTTGNGVFDSAQYAIDNNLAPVISMSYGGCETQNASFIPFFEPILQQASTEGITFLAASGDSGAASCDGTNQATATGGLSVNYPASSPEVTGVGGTEFNEGAGLYWGTNGTHLGSALSYIPEVAWNDTDVTGTGGSNGTTLAASGGGPSTCGVEANGVCTGGFSKPSWQVGPGVPSDGVRDVPDVSITASANHDGYFLCSGGSCAGGIAADNFIVGGTSASTPVFAGMVVLANELAVKSGAQSAPGLGNINSLLYSSAQSSGQVFHDVTTGTNIVPCTSGSIDCPTAVPFQYGYSAGAGYDLVTGLGSVDGTYMAAASAGIAVTETTNPTPSVLTGSSVTLSAVVDHKGSVVPTGTVIFMDGATQLGSPVSLASGTATYQTSALVGGVHSLTSVYSGDSNFPSLTSSATSLLVTLDQPNTTSLTLSSTNVDAGSAVTFTGTVTGNGVSPTGTVTFLNGSSLLNSGSLSGGVTSFTTSSLTANTYTVTANYSGDANYAISSSPPSVLSVVDFSLTPSATITVTAAGQTGSTTLTATPVGGFSGTIAYTCTGPVPAGAACTVTPTSTGATVTVTTTGASAALTRPGNVNNLYYAMVLPGLLGIVLFGQGKKRKGRSSHLLTLICILGLSVMWMSACGGSSSSSGTPNNATPMGTNTLTVTAASGTLSHNSVVTLIVQ